MVDTVESFEQITQDSTTDPPEEPPSNPLRYGTQTPPRNMEK